MADDDKKPAENEIDETECQPCRGTGKVTSNLGGEPKEVECPWCEGTGKFIPEHDAQAHFKPTDPAAAE